MKIEEIEKKVIEIIAEQFGRDISTISLGDKFREDFMADSLDMIELVIECEEEFEITIPDEDAVAKIQTVQEAVEFVTEIIKNQKGG